jgi:activator of 2-hydroxyglutaryl-CoA dehydratase
MALVRRVGVEPEVTFTGGVSRNVGMVRALEAVLGHPLNVSAEGHYMGALGAALFALERAEAAAGGAPAAQAAAPAGRA